MGKASVVVVYTVIALFLLLLISYSPKNSHTRQHRRLKLRSNFSFSTPSAPPTSNREHAIPFDPVVADIERRREDREWERAHFSMPHHDAPGEEAQPEWEDFMDAEDYLNDDQRFNLTRRLVQLFPNIDLDPADGFLSAEELTEWNLKQQTKDVMHRTAREMELHDKNHDRLVSFQEYEPPSWARQQPSDDHNSSKIDVGWWSEEHFNASDVDGDGFLNLTEFNDFLHPADSTSPKLIQWLCKEEIRERDRDKDGKLDFQEFFHGLFDSIRDYNDVYNASYSSREVPANKLFAELDHDKDGYLSEEELKSVIGKLHPSERYYARQQADRSLEEADMDKDGRLSLHEMVQHPYAFYSSIFADEDDYLYEYRDELR